MNLIIEKHENPAELSRHAAEYISAVAMDCVRKRGFFTLMLSGGATPRMLYQYLANYPFRERIPWNRTHLFWGDERCVPPDNAASNFFMARQAFISQIEIPQNNIHRIRGEMLSPHKAAVIYEREIRRFFHSGNKDSDSVPSFDIIILGVGKDGHTASLFPGDDALNEMKRWVVAVHAPVGSSPSLRITVTLPLINNAERILFIVSGVEKRKIVQKILNDSRDKKTLPAARVQALEEIKWYTYF